MNDNQSESGQETLLTFPCEFTIKVFGTTSGTFQAEVLAIIHQQVEAFSEESIVSRPSENGKYIALSITIQAESKKQLDDIYRALSACPSVIMAL
jgi:putative lipoic acid-binding regulatory protein